MRWLMCSSAILERTESQQLRRNLGCKQTRKEETIQSAYSSPTTVPSQPEGGGACSQREQLRLNHSKRVLVLNHHNITRARIMTVITPWSISTSGAAPVEVAVMGVIEVDAAFKVEVEYGVMDSKLPPPEPVVDTAALEEVACLPPGTETAAVTLNVLALIHSSLLFTCSGFQYNKY